MFFTRLVLFIVGLLLSGCQTPPTPPPQKAEIVLAPLGHYYWENRELSKLDVASQSFELNKAKGQCTIQKLSVPIPSPACVQPPSRDCSMYDYGNRYDIFVDEAKECEWEERNGGPPPKCDYSSVRAAEQAQDQLWSACMTVSGWVSKFSNEGYGSDTTGGVFSDPVTSNDKSVWYVKLASIQASDHTTSAIVRRECKADAVLFSKCKPYQGVYTFYPESNTFKIDQGDLGKMLPNSASSIIHRYLEKERAKMMSQNRVSQTQPN